MNNQVPHFLLWDSLSYFAEGKRNQEVVFSQVTMLQSTIPLSTHTLPGITETILGQPTFLHQKYVSISQSEKYPFITAQKSAAAVEKYK